MKIIKTILIALLVLTSVLYIGNGIAGRLSGRDEGPRIECSDEVLEVSVHDGDDVLLSGVTAEDAQDGDLTDRIIIGGRSKLIGGDTAKVTCMVFDSDDNMASVVRTVRYTDYRRPVIALEQPLVYGSTDEAKLLKAVTVTDMLDGDLSDKARVSTLWATDDERVYSATILVTNSMGDTASVDVPVIIGTPGSIRLKRQILYLEPGAEFDPKDLLSSDRTGVQIRNEVDTQASGCYWVWYTKGEDIAIATVVVE